MLRKVDIFLLPCVSLQWTSINCKSWMLHFNFASVFTSALSNSCKHVMKSRYLAQIFQQLRYVLWRLVHICPPHFTPIKYISSLRTGLSSWQWSRYSFMQSVVIVCLVSKYCSFDRPSISKVRNIPLGLSKRLNVACMRVADCRVADWEDIQGMASAMVTPIFDIFDMMQIATKLWYTSVTLPTCTIGKRFYPKLLSYSQSEKAEV